MQGIRRRLLRKESSSQVRGSPPRSRPFNEDGFLLLEVVIGFSLFCVVILATSSGTVASMASATVAHERFIASTLVSEDIANATALPFADLVAGLNPTQDSLSSDPNIQVVGSTYVLTLTGATLATSNTNTSEAPLVPHISTVTVGIPYSVATYPQASSTGLVTLVVVVSWTTTLGRKYKVVGETQIAAP